MLPRGVPAEANCQQQSTGSEEFYDQQEIVVRIHGRVTFSWYVFQLVAGLRFLSTCS